MSDNDRPVVADLVAVLERLGAHLEVIAKETKQIRAILGRQLEQTKRAGSEEESAHS